MSNEDKTTIYVMGKEYLVPDELSIMQALEAAGYKLLRGVGCRGGFCGACATIYRLPGDFKLKVGLACQTVIKQGMSILQLPYFPTNKPRYSIEEMEANLETIMKVFPEVNRCLQCNTCTKICPQDIKVMDYIACAIRGDIEGLAKKSFNCLMCGLCASRCPAELVQYQIGLLGRRLYARELTNEAKHVKQRIDEINANKFEEELNKMLSQDRSELECLYEQRDIEE